MTNQLMKILDKNLTYQKKKKKLPEFIQGRGFRNRLMSLVEDYS